MGKNTIFLIPTVGKPFSLRVKMTELYFLPYKATEIYGTKRGIPCFGRSEIPISTGQHAILLISAAEAAVCRRGLPLKLPPAAEAAAVHRPAGRQSASRQTAARPVHRRRRWTDRAQTETFFLCAGQQVTGTGLSSSPAQPFTGILATTKPFAGRERLPENAASSS